MGFFSEIRKLFFVKESVAKSGANKVKEQAEEMVEDIVEVGKDLSNKASDKIDNLVEAFTTDETDVSEPEDSLVDTSSEPTAETEATDEPSVAETPTLADEVGKKVIEGTEKVGEAVLEKAGDLSEKAADLAESVGEKVMEGGEVLKDKAKQAMEYIDRKLDETMDKAKDLDEEMSANDKDGDGFADEAADLSRSTLEGSDDFFEKAKRFADGQPMEDKTIIQSERASDIEKPEYKSYGFEDMDGDGNELIDDAIIEDEED